jgi:hypothetical protein
VNVLHRVKNFLLAKAYNILEHDFEVEGLEKQEEKIRSELWKESHLHLPMPRRIVPRLLLQEPFKIVK